MRRIDIVLALLFVGVIVALVFLPDVIENWGNDAEEPVVEQPQLVEVPPAEPAQPQTRQPEPEPLSPELERERVGGILMLHEACADRFTDFASRAQPVFETWKRQHAETLASDSERDFHIVIGEPEAPEGAQVEQTDDELRGLCERNLEAMQADIDGAGE